MQTKKLLLAALLTSVFAQAHAIEVPGADEPQAAGKVLVVDIDDKDGKSDKGEVRSIVTRREGPLLLASLGDPASPPELESVLQNVQIHVQEKVLKNAPYSAEVISEQLQTLGDGNQITRKSTSFNYRDAAGSTRQEIHDDKGELVLVTIHNATDGMTYMLHPKSRTADKIGMSKEAIRDLARTAADKARAQVDGTRVQIDNARKARKEGQPVEIHVRDQDDKDIDRDVIIKRVERGDGNARNMMQENVQVRVRTGVEKTLSVNVNTAVNTALGNAFGDAKWSTRSVSKDLGSRDIDGVKAEGKLRSYEIPAGEVGNKNPITVATETWYSPELQITVYSKHSDPRSGDRVFRLGSLKREEPAAALFTVPADYTVKDTMAGLKKLADKTDKK